MNEFCQKINTDCRKFITTQDEFQNNINTKLDELSDFIESSMSHQNSPVDHNINHNSATNDVPYKPPQQTKLNDISNPTKNFEDYKQNFICDEVCSVLSDFITDKQTLSNSMAGLLFHTQYSEPYPYPGAPESEPQPLPAEIKPISKIEDAYPNLDTYQY